MMPAPATGANSICAMKVPDVPDWARVELDRYLVRLTDQSEARATEQELMSLEARRAAALRNLGLP